MNVRELIEILSSLDPDSIVLVDGGYDHSYNRVMSVCDCEVESYNGGLYFAEFAYNNRNEKAQLVNATILSIQ